MTSCKSKQGLLNRSDRCSLSDYTHACACAHTELSGRFEVSGHGGLTAAWLCAALSGLIPGSADNGGGFRGRERRAAGTSVELWAGDAQPESSSSPNTSRTMRSGQKTLHLSRILCTLSEHAGDACNKKSALHVCEHNLGNSNKKLTFLPY